jgi:hypothetical protein
VGTPLELDLSLRLPKDLSTLKVLNLGAGHCASPISSQIPNLIFEKLVNVEIWASTYVKLSRVKFATLDTTNVLMDLNSYLAEHSEQDEFDVILFIDVLEHVEKDIAVNLIRLCRYASKRVVIFLPIGKCKQDPYDGNPYQEHLSTWELSDFEGAQVEYFENFHKHFSPPVHAAWVIYEKP